MTGSSVPAGNTSNTSELWLIRHGETEWSRSGQHTSRTDLPLTPEGERRAAALKNYLTQKTFSAVFVSPMQRARRTCELAGLGAQAQVDPDLSEWDYGQYEGKTSAEIHQTNPHWTIWNGTPPGGETAAQIASRADRMIARTMSMKGNVALFGHGHMFRALAARWLELEPQAGRLFALSTGTVSILGHERAQRVIQMWNRSSD